MQVAPIFQVALRWNSAYPEDVLDEPEGFVAYPENQSFFGIEAGDAQGTLSVIGVWKREYFHTNFSVPLREPCNGPHATEDNAFFLRPCHFELILIRRLSQYVDAEPSVHPRFRVALGGISVGVFLAPEGI